MDKIDTKALQGKLLKFAGLEHKRISLTYDPIPTYGYYLNNKFIRISCPDLVRSLEAQLKYIWPKLRELGYMIRYQYSELRDENGKVISDWIYYCSIFDMKYKRGLKYSRFDAMNNDSPAIACALAISKLIDALNKVDKNE
jgi:hypothetical protein